MSESAKELIEKNLATKEPYLELGNCGLDGTEECLDLLGECDHLKKLVFSNSWYDAGRNGNWENQQSKNKGQANKLKQIPRYLPKNLDCLITIGERGIPWEISDIEPLKQVTQLKQLFLSSNKVKDITAIQYLINLRELFISYCLLTSIQPIAKLIHLERLHLVSNQIDYLKPLQNLLKLTDLQLNNNQVSDLGDLTNLKKLQYLYVSNNSIFNPQPLSKLPSLETLYLSNNKIEDFSLGILKSLPQLKELSLTGCPIKNILPEVFDRRGNRINEIRSYLEALEKGKVLNTQAKLIWLGNGEVGKTTLSHQLRKNEFQSQIARTHGILIKDWEVSFDELPQEVQEKLQTIVRNNNQKNTHYQIELPSTITLKIWDFGGQEYYHATHRLFLNHDALYLLVWDNASNYYNEELGIYPIEYWRKSIQDKAPHSIVLEIQNKTRNDGQENHKKRQYKVEYRDEEDRRSVQQYTIDIEKLKKGILDQLPHLDHLGNQFPAVYDDIRMALRKLDVPYLSFDAYQELCQNNDFTSDKIMQNEAQIRTLTQYLHETGTIICYKFDKRFSNLPKLQDYVFTQPAWVTDIIYKILSKEVTADRPGFAQGEFDFTHIQQVLQNSNSPDQLEAEVWQELLLVFELVFKFEKKGKEILVAPQYLPKQCSNLEALEYAIDCNLEHSFSLYYPHFLPKSLFLRFIAQYDAQSTLYLYWKNGLLFEHESGKGIYATCDYTNRLITVKIQDRDVQVAHDVFKFFWANANEHTEVSVWNAPERFVNLRKLEDKLHRGKTEIESSSGEELAVAHFDFLFAKQPKDTDTDLQQTQATQMGKEEILKLIDENVAEALTALHDRLGKNDSKLNNLNNDFIDQPQGFSLSKFSERLKVFVKVTL